MLRLQQKINSLPLHQFVFQSLSPGPGPHSMQCPAQSANDCDLYSVHYIRTILVPTEIHSNQIQQDKNGI